VVIGLLLGAVYYNVGNDASKVLSNSSCIFFFTMFLFFANSMPCVIASKCNRNKTEVSYHCKEPVLRNEGKQIKSVYTTNHIVM
jgi:glutamate synthase domain-containing protein 2